jgi:hypothetical protein
MILARCAVALLVIFFGRGLDVVVVVVVLLGAGLICVSQVEVVLIEGEAIVNRAPI